MGVVLAVWGVKGLSKRKKRERDLMDMDNCVICQGKGECGGAWGR